MSLLQLWYVVKHRDFPNLKSHLLRTKIVPAIFVGRGHSHPFKAPCFPRTLFWRKLADCVKTVYYFACRTSYPSRDSRKVQCDVISIQRTIYIAILFLDDLEEELLSSVGISGLFFVGIASKLLLVSSVSCVPKFSSGDSYFAMRVVCVFLALIGIAVGCIPGGSKCDPMNPNGDECCTGFACRDGLYPPDSASCQPLA
ncbi:hypothetical protein BDV29DRAFT_173387 [Aspergillus leporis]|uniref:Uncharacterized protein n=1 Tax=Aspergillus leporis TaxID=41062 RepID=A0A5N5X1E3_9EURO|nr:hypothetical protein BDV29DRAFT_173387 [Aspergillus leporis]